MTKKDKAYYILEELEKLYQTTHIPLDHASKYTLLISLVPPNNSGQL